MNLLVNEIFRSVQGEGLLIGQPSVFLRLALCNVNCPMCDTDYHHGTKVATEDVLIAVTHSYSGSRHSKGLCRHLVITGGEPYIHPGLGEFLSMMASVQGWHVTIETSGSIIPGTFKDVDLVSVSPKFCSLKPGTGEQLALPVLFSSFMRILELPRNDIQVKLVWNGSHEDVPDFLPTLIEQLEKEAIPVFFQPMTAGPEFELFPYLRQFKKVAAAVQETFGSWPRVLPQMHKFFSWR